MSQIAYVDCGDLSISNENLSHIDLDGIPDAEKVVVQLSHANFAHYFNSYKSGINDLGKIFTRIPHPQLKNGMIDHVATNSLNIFNSVIQQTTSNSVINKDKLHYAWSKGSSSLNHGVVWRHFFSSEVISALDDQIGTYHSQHNPDGNVHTSDRVILSSNLSMLGNENTHNRLYLIFHNNGNNFNGTANSPIYTIEFPHTNLTQDNHYLEFYLTTPENHGLVAFDRSSNDYVANTQNNIIGGPSSSYFSDFQEGILRVQDNYNNSMNNLYNFFYNAMFELESYSNSVADIASNSELTAKQEIEDIYDLPGLYLQIRTIAPGTRSTGEAATSDANSTARRNAVSSLEDKAAYLQEAADLISSAKQSITKAVEIAKASYNFLDLMIEYGDAIQTATGSTNQTLSAHIAEGTHDAILTQIITLYNTIEVNLRTVIQNYKEVA